MEYIVFGFVAFFLILLFMAKGFYDEHKSQKEFKRHLERDYGQIHEKEYRPEQYASISRYFERHPGETQIDDITWNDLSMDDVYKGMNETYSSAGEEILYYTLRSPHLSDEKLKHMEEQIQYFTSNQTERVKLQILFHKLGYTGRFSLYEYLDHLDILGNRSNIKHYILNFLYIPGIVLCAVKPSMGVIWLVVIMLYNMFSYFKEKNEIEPYITSFAYLMKLMDAAERVEAVHSERIQSEAQKLHEHKKQLGRFKRGSYWLMSSGRMSGSGNILDIFLDYCRMIFHLDLIKFNTMLDQVRKHIADVDELFYTLGYLETVIAIGAYRKSLDGAFCIPVLSNEEQIVYTTENLYHPLIQHPVKNSINVRRGVLLTGSNASGKSTFLKTVALNTIFAQTIHTVLADSYEGSFFGICSSMTLRDNLSQGESYYMVEIRAIKRILDMAAKESKMLCFVDEVLRGTNTVERIAASTEILKSLSSKNVLCFAATHDVELTDLLSAQYDNYHFEEEIKDGDVYFNYCLMKGKATTRNAIKLLGIMGYHETIIENANNRAEYFMNTGIWK
ncbi:MAG TPA: hypothetical protein VJY54_09855 [Lachnospiraceae bacterium]|nr:hypothetical protein [Lachnospiraceae bacterium]